MTSEADPFQQSLFLLIQYLEGKREAGERAVWIAPKARKDLQQLRQLEWKAESAGPRETPVRGPGPDASTGESAGGAASPRVAEGADTHSSEAEGDPGDTGLVAEGETPEEKLAWLRRRAQDWPPARKLDSLRETMVFAVGNPRAELMLVGEAPGAEEERQGEPFVGRAGQKLNQILKAMGVRRDEVYISNIVKFRPALPNQGESNRKPTPEEMASCVDFVRAEVDVVRPRVIVALGGTAAQGLLGLADSVGVLRREFRELKGVPVKVTYHPSYLLRNAGLAEKRKVWEDMLEVMEQLGLPISEKQRKFFQS